LLGALALASAAWLGGGRWLASTPQPQPELAALAVKNVDGAPAALSAFQGKPTVINLWASWCPPCRREMPAFAAAQAANPDVNFVFLNQAEAPGDVTQFLNEHAPGLQNVLIDPAGEASRKFSNRGLPATLFLDAQGRLVDLRVGELSTASLAQRLESIRAAQ
jgi:thiol-disulfide isomerase/thioredoxin